MLRQFLRWRWHLPRLLSVEGDHRLRGGIMSLDRWITGNYGNDYWRGAEPDTYDEPETAPIPQGTRVIHEAQRGTVLRGNGTYTLVRWDTPQWIAGMRYDQTPVPTKELVVEREAQPRPKR